MSQRDGFASGFLLGAVVGGAIGGIVGALAATRRLPVESEEHEDEVVNLKDSEQTIESTRRSLETKIAQLNVAIDDVRQQLGVVNGSPHSDV